MTGVGLLERNQRARHRIRRSDHAEQAVVVRINGRREISALGTALPASYSMRAHEFCSDGGIASLPNDPMRLLVRFNNLHDHISGAIRITRVELFTCVLDEAAKCS